MKQFEPSPYSCPLPFRFAHFNTMYPHFMRKGINVKYDRERLQLEDGDFIDLDFIHRDKDSIVLILHGLEGSSQSHYAKGMAKAMSKADYSVVAMNQRGCSGELNMKFESYHSGRTDDLESTIQFLIQKQYKSIYITGFSLGGNICLKYAGESGDLVPKQVKALVGISVPTDLADSGKILNKRSNYFYMARFRRMLRTKVQDKLQNQDPPSIDPHLIQKFKTFKEFDDLYTAPFHGFKDADDYYARSSSKQYIPSIKRPCLIISAKDDPFYGPQSIPAAESQDNTYIHLLTPDHGGHCGFANYRFKGLFWHEQTVLQFFNAH